MEKQTLENAINLVENSFPTIFSKDDVLRLLQSIQIVSEDNAPVGNVTDLMRQLGDEINSKIDETSIISAYDVATKVCENAGVDEDDMSYTIGYQNRIEIDELHLDHGSVENAIDEAADEAKAELSNTISGVISDYIYNLEEELKKDEDNNTEDTPETTEE